ncbi:hypothetical protein DV515_00006118 [Chloebia gouldiae]|uniref:Chemokine interleukin-8-like domain-containing protein n=1 Tax=Chloebia gouldiae TaxID=44316 RepID=A0A3L8SLB8_CHLGU|nr:hypothetical protein DV515_00006118 [Chloebia gouldiae]
MKLLALCGFLFVCVLCLSVVAVEGQVRRRCCSKVPKRNKNPHEGISSKIIAVPTRRYCKPCRWRDPMFPGPLPQLK